MRQIIIDGNKFSTLEVFYDEIDSLLTKDLDWKTGHNFNAFNDLLRGGFGVHEYLEPIKLIWQNSQKSKQDLNEIVAGSTVYEVLVEIIHFHEHIDFLED